MDNRPISQKFLTIEHNSQIVGTIPRDSETRPHVQVSVDDSALDGQPDLNSKPIGIIGPSINGIPNHVYKITSIEQAKNIFGGGGLLTAIELAWQPNRLAYNNGGVIYAERVQDATQASLNVGALHFYSTAYGDNANDTAISMNEDPLENGTWDLEVTNKHDSYKADYNGLGLLAHIQYIPNSWDKYHIPAGQKDYARASIDVVQDKTVDKYSNGASKVKTTGRAVKLVFHIHDTKKPAIFFNDATNNGNGTSTVYAADEPGYNDSMPTEEISQHPASAGELNPNRGKFVDTVFPVDLTNPKFTNMTTLLAYLQQLNFGGNAHLEISANEDAHLSHIPPFLLNITNHRINIMGNLNDTTTDNKGNVIEPGGLWSTLGSIVDALRYNPKVHATADMMKQFNYISTVPASATALTSLASEYADSANAASLNASYDYSEASLANDNNVNSLADEYKNTGDSYAQNAQDYNDLENFVDNKYWNDINAVTYGGTKADSAAAKVVSSAEAVESPNSKNITSMGHQALSASRAASSASASASSLMNAYNKANTANQSALKSANTDLTNDQKAYQQHATTSLSNAIGSLKTKVSSLNNNHFSSTSANNEAKAATQQTSAYKSLMTKIHALQAKNKQAKADASKAMLQATQSDAKTEKKRLPKEQKNMQYVQNYTVNVVKQLHDELFNKKRIQPNIIDNDLNSLTRVMNYMRHPASPVDVSIIKAGQKAAQPLSNALNDLKNYKANVKGSSAALDIDLGKVEKAIESANSKKAAPKGILPNAYGDGVIDILGEPIYAFTPTNLAGGSTSQIPIDWSNKFHYFNDTPVYDFVVVSPRESVHANLAAYIGDRFEANHNMRGFVGAGRNASPQELIDRSAALDNERICLYGTSGDYTIDDGMHEDIPAYLGAAIVAGIDSGLLPGDSILNKKIAYNRIDQDFSSSELDALNENGVLTANPIVNRGVTSEYRISNDVTTNNDSSDPIKAQLSLGEVTDYLFDELRGFLQKDIGRVVTAGSSDQIVTDVNAFLHDHCSKYNGGEGLIVDYKADDTFCEIHNESAYITFNVAPSMPLKYISVVGRYSGFDEVSGNDNGASFQFIGTNGELSDDDDDQDDTDGGYEDANNLINGSSV